jgi:hypothetical protein
MTESSKFYSKFNKIKALFDEIQHKNIDIKLDRVLDNDEMLQILMTSAIQKSMSAKNTSNKSSEKLLDFAVNFLNYFLKNIVNNEK